MTLDRFVRVKYRYEEEKVEKLTEILGELRIECARTIEEKVDLQFDALKHLHDSLNDTETFLKLVIANSIVSYQLTAKGEEWWWEFSRYFSNSPPKNKIWVAYSQFLPNSRTNRRLVKGKLKRLEKLEPFLESLTLDEMRDYYLNNMLGLRDKLAEIMKSKKSAKTIVFSVKMFGYGARIAFSNFVPYPMEIEIPDDVRINAYTKRFTNEPVALFWSRIAEEVNIPPLHIDSILWPVLGGNEEVMARLRKHCPQWERIVELSNL
ncbi:N-glycosylase/DNA lyase [Thermococcus sp.]